jgi:hypothetical protein
MFSKRVFNCHKDNGSPNIVWVPGRMAEVCGRVVAPLSPGTTPIRRVPVLPDLGFALIRFFLVRNPFSFLVRVFPALLVRVDAPCMAHQRGIQTWTDFFLFIFGFFVTAALLFAYLYGLTCLKYRIPPSNLNSISQSSFLSA